MSSGINKLLNILVLSRYFLVLCTHLPELLFLIFNFIYCFDGNLLITYL